MAATVAAAAAADEDVARVKHATFPNTNCPIAKKRQKPSEIGDKSDSACGLHSMPSAAGQWAREIERERTE